MIFCAINKVLVRKALSSAILMLIWAVPVPAGDTTRPTEAPDPARVRASVDGGLRWLADNQITEGPLAGSWACREYPTAVASFAGLAFLANGHLPGQGAYGDTVATALDFVRRSMTQDGFLGGVGANSTMYTHAICTLFGLAALGMLPDASDDRDLAEWTRRGLRLILQAQQVPKRSFERGGWRYTPSSQDSDVSVTAWQLLTLHTARQCGFEIDPVAIQEALRYIGDAWMETEEGGGFLYRPGVSLTNRLSVGSSGVALFIKRLIETDPSPMYRKTGDFLRRFPPAWGGPQYNGYFYFVSFYLTQGMFQQGGKDWRDYNAALQTILTDRQEGDGRWPFPPGNRTHADNVGYAYATALSILMLSMDQQYLPMYQRQVPLY